MGHGKLTQRFDTKDRVFDADRRLPLSPARVVGYVGDNAAEYEYLPGRTVASVDAGYPPHDRVVRVVFENDLDREFDHDEWILWNHDDFADRVADAEVKTYDYHETRLRPLKNADPSMLR